MWNLNKLALSISLKSYAQEAHQSLVGSFRMPVALAGDNEMLSAVGQWRGFQRRDPSQPASQWKRRPTHPLSFYVLLNHTCLRERSFAFEVCLREMISLKCSPWRGHGVWDLLKRPRKMAPFKHNILGQLEYRYCPKLELKKKKKFSLVQRKC